MNSSSVRITVLALAGVSFSPLLSSGCDPIHKIQDLQVEMTGLAEIKLSFELPKLGKLVKDGASAEFSVSGLIRGTCVAPVISSDPVECRTVPLEFEQQAFLFFATATATRDGHDAQVTATVGFPSTEQFILNTLTDVCFQFDIQTPEPEAAHLVVEIGGLTLECDAVITDGVFDTPSCQFV